MCNAIVTSELLDYRLNFLCVQCGYEIKYDLSKRNLSYIQHTVANNFNKK